jgi:hypothetical protein
MSHVNVDVFPPTVRELRRPSPRSVKLVVTEFTDAETMRSS